jgi:ribosome-associated toxin RatA of RatAB toxin-antitoxin module
MKYTILFLTLLFGVKVVKAQDDWTFKTEQDGIKVYNSTSSTSKIKPIKVECIFNATPSQLVMVLLDIKAYPEWVYHTKSASLVKQVSPAEVYYYTEVNVPWPAQNRDFVAHVTATQNPETKTVTVDAPTVPGFVAEKEGLARIHESKGKWVITPVGTNQVKVVYFLQIDPGGSAPSFLINMFAAEGPLQSFKKLKTQLQKAAYKNASLPFIHN